MGVDIRGPLVSAEQLDRLALLWRLLHRHHLNVAAFRGLVGDLDQSWARRRAWYAALMTTERGCYFAAEDDGELVGYTFLRQLPAPTTPSTLLEVCWKS